MPTDRPTLRALLTLAWPVVISRAAQVVIGLSDARMVAPLGKNALAATTAGGLNAWMLLIFPMGVVFLVSSFASQLFGRGDGHAARRYGWYGLAIAAAAQVFACLAIPFLGPALGVFGFEPAVRELMTGYLTLRLLSTGPAIGIEALANYYGGLGRTRLPMRVNLLAMVLNVAGNAVLIYGAFGLPAMGVRGAGLASALATTVAFVVLLAVFVREARSAGSMGRRLSLSEFRRLLRFGIPSGANWFFEFLAFQLFLNVVVTGLGTSALAAFGAVIAINSAAFMPTFGLASAGAILVGQAIGAEKKEAVPRVVGLTLASCATWNGLAALSYLVLPELVFDAFAPLGPEEFETRAVALRMLQLSAAWQLFDAASMALAEALRAAGDTTFPMWARIVVAWGLWFPGSWLATHHYGGGDVAAVLSLVSYLGVLAFVFWLRFRSGAWRAIRLTEELGAGPVLAAE